MGPPPRSLTAEANSCFMVRVPHGPNRIQGCGASIAPERGLPSDQLYRTSNNEGHRVEVTLDTKVLIQGCVKTRTFYWAGTTIWPARLLARFSGPEASNRSPSSADSITTMPGFRFSVHTGRRLKPCLFPHLFPPLELFEHRLDRLPKRRASALFMVDGRRRLYSADRI